ncbi:hypothetical protein MKX03_026742 [Papaver bracteatum]|nr:hypothetical protein MKX03_026742 [Papaver bracteatum]
MLSYAVGEYGKDISDRELVTLWFKFLWETYRMVLEILCNNFLLEALYAEPILVTQLVRETAAVTQEFTQSGYTDDMELENATHMAILTLKEGCLELMIGALLKMRMKLRQF